jgi:hypothetical protein
MITSTSFSRRISGTSGNDRNAELIEGYLPSKQLKLVQAWAVLHEEELLENFKNLGKDFKSWNRIEPLR